MQRKGKILTIGIVLALGLIAVYLFSSIREESIKGMIVFTQISPGDSGKEQNEWQSGRYPHRSRIAALDPLQPQAPLKVLTEDFYSARAPEISFDGKRLLFAAKKQVDDHWQIWEMKLEGLQTRPVTSGLLGCTDPAYLPDDRIIFSAFNSNLPYKDEPEKVVNALFTCNWDGSDVKRITFHPQSDFVPAMLADGRVIFASSAGKTLTNSSRLLAMRYDGMWVEPFYENVQGGRQASRAWEAPDDKIIFVETSPGNSRGGRLVAISLKRPLHSRVDLAPALKGDFHSAFPMPSGQYLISYRQPGFDSYALYEFDPQQKQPGRLIIHDANFHSVEPVLAAEHPRPKKFVSLINKDKNSALIYCQNADKSDLPIAGSLPLSTRSAAVQVLGINGILGEVPLEEDGSFYLEIPVDRPLRFRTISENGKIVRGPSAWIWARPNEKRGCIGCHEDRELAPENRLLRAISKPPVSLLPSSLVLDNKRDSKKVKK